MNIIYDIVDPPNPNTTTATTTVVTAAAAAAAAAALKILCITANDPLINQ